MVWNLVQKYRLPREYPRMYQLTASVVEGAAQVELTMNEYLYATGSIRARNLLVLPCDNGLFRPNFKLLESGTLTTRPKSTHEMGKFVNDLGDLDLGIVSLSNLILTSSLIKSMHKDSGDIENQIISSKFVKEIANLGGNIDRFVTKSTVKVLKNNF